MNMQDLFSTYRKISFRQAIILLTFWTVIAIIITNQLYFTSIKNGLNPSWTFIFIDQLPIWFMWGLFSPTLLFLINKYPFDAEKWRRSIVVYLLVGIVMLMILSNLTLVYLLSIHGYLDLSTATFQDYLPYLISRFTNDLLIFSLVLMIMIIGRAYSVRKNHQLNMALMKLKNHQLQNQLTQAQLQALKLQLSPHFLFNTLNTISTLTLLGEKKVSINITSKLGEFLRRTLDFEEHQLVTLSKELEFFDLYLDIEATRFKDRLRLERKVDPGCLNFKVPNLILQPLIENAVKYGISKSKEASLIELKISGSEEYIEMELFNEGPSLFEKSLEKGIGLSNIENRLSKLYGDDYMFRVSNDEDRQGVKSMVRIPVSSN